MIKEVEYRGDVSELGMTVMRGVVYKMKKRGPRT